MRHLSLLVLSTFLLLAQQSVAGEWIIYKGSVVSKSQEYAKAKRLRHVWIAVKYNFETREVEDHVMYHLDDKSGSRGSSMNYNVQVSTAPLERRDQSLILFRRPDTAAPLATTYSLALKGKHRILLLSRKGQDHIASFPGNMTGIEISTAPEYFEMASWAVSFSEKLSRKANEIEMSVGEVGGILDRDAQELAKKLRQR